jgi:glycosyltransferase involved in cell wall biosynthesis
VVAFDCTGLRDIVVHLETGYLAEPFRPEDLAAGIEWVLADEPRRVSLGLNARKRVLEKFDYKVVAEKMTRIYREAMNGTNL